MFALIACSGFRPDADPPGDEAFRQWCREVYTADSGYVNSAQEYRLIRLICDADTSVFTAPYCEFFRSDTLHCSTPVAPDSTGKYYRQLLPDGTIRWVLCMQVALYWEVPYVFEIRQDGNRFTLAGWDVFPHGNYACCWHTPMSGFYKTGPYFLLETCNTGSAFCAGTAGVLFFPLAGSNDSMPESADIPVYFYQGQGRCNQYLSSQPMLAGDTLLVNYTFAQEDPETGDCRKQYSFSAFFKIDARNRTVVLLNREAILKYEEIAWFFE